MFSGRRPPRRSSAPDSGKTAISIGNSSKVGWKAATVRGLPEQQRGELAPPRQRRRVVEAPGLEELQQLPARRLLVPGLVAPDRLDQRGDRPGPVARGVERDGKVDPRRMVVRVGGEARLELGQLG